jgi:hypothetical protein
MFCNLKCRELAHNGLCVRDFIQRHKEERQRGQQLQLERDEQADQLKVRTVAAATRYVSWLVTLYLVRAL